MKSKYLSQIVPLLTILFPALCLAFGNGYQPIPVVLFLISLPLLFSTPRNLFTKEVNMLLIAFILYFGLIVLSTILKDESLSLLDRPSRFIMCIPIFLLILRYPPKFSWLTNSIVIGAYFAGISALLCFFYYGQVRAFTNISDNLFLKGFQPIQSGNMAMTFGIMSLPIAIYHLKKCNPMFAVFCSIGAAFGISASYLSGSRGGWVFVPLAIAYLIYVNRKSFSFTKYNLVSCLILILPTVIMISSFSMTANSEQNRIAEMSDNLTEYSKGNEYSSVGVRLELWKDAFYTFKESPLFGAGSKERLELRKQWGDEGLIHKYISLQTYHAHNQFFDTLALMGIVGFIGLIGIFIVPIAIFRRRNKAKLDTLSTINQCGILHVVMMTGYCLTQSMLSHNSGSVFYPVVTVILLASSLTIVKMGKPTNAPVK